MYPARPCAPDALSSFLHSYTTSFYFNVKKLAIYLTPTLTVIWTDTTSKYTYYVFSSHSREGKAVREGGGPGETLRGELPDCGMNICGAALCWAACATIVNSGVKYLRYLAAQLDKNHSHMRVWRSGLAGSRDFSSLVENHMAPPGGSCWDDE